MCEWDTAERVGGDDIVQFERDCKKCNGRHQGEKIIATCSQTIIARTYDQDNTVLAIRNRVGMLLLLLSYFTVLL